MPVIREHIEGYQTAEQRNLLLKIFSYEFSQRNLFLTGGTGLSVFYAGHRTSKDVDLFSMKEINLLEYVRIFKDIGKIITTISESPSFCSYIYENGIKVDYVYDRFSAATDKETYLIDETKINIDILENIAINKICAVASREEPKDIIDLTWLFMNAFTFEKDFIHLFRKAVEREGLLDDLSYVKGVFNHIRERPDSALRIIGKSLLQEIDSSHISELFSHLEDAIDRLIIDSNLNLHP